MALTSALYTALSGLDVNSHTLDIVGNNIANVNTHAYKSTRANFTTQLAQNISFGTPPGADTGGTNPAQVGLGSRFVGTQRNFANGAIQATGINTDLALEGNGLFIVRQSGQVYFTRNGAFDLNARNELVTTKTCLYQKPIHEAAPRVLPMRVTSSFKSSISPVDLLHNLKDSASVNRRAR